MSIKVELVSVEGEGGREELVCPRFYCDWCEKAIADGDLGVAMSAMPSLGTPQTVYHTHKGDCQTKFESTRTESICWEELSNHADMLAHNSIDAPDEATP